MASERDVRSRVGLVLMGVLAACVLGAAPSARAVIYVFPGQSLTLTEDTNEEIRVYNGGILTLAGGVHQGLLNLQAGAIVTIEGAYGGHEDAVGNNGTASYNAALLTLEISSLNPWQGTLTYGYGTASTGFEVQVESLADIVFTSSGGGGPVAEAGADVGVDSVDQEVTVIEGIATGASYYRWLTDGVTLLEWTSVGIDGAASLDLGTLETPLSLGTYTLTLDIGEPEGEDYVVTASDTMTLTILNTPPDASISPENQTVQINLDFIVISASLIDFDGDTLSYEWITGGEVLDSGTVEAPAGGDPIAIDDLLVFPWDPRFPLGENTVELIVDDGVNDPVSSTAIVNVVDTLGPTLCPIPSRRILWPPNHQLLPVTIWANAFDNGGGPLTLDVTVESSQPPEPGETDYYIDSVNDATGVIQLRLRSERWSRGFGRVYKITVTATDESENQSSAIVRILAPRRGWRMWRWCR